MEKPAGLHPFPPFPRCPKKWLFSWDQRVRETTFFSSGQGRAVTERHRALFLPHLQLQKRYCRDPCHITRADAVRGVPEEAGCLVTMPGDRCRGSAPARRATTWQDTLGLAHNCVLRVRVPLHQEHTCNGITEDVCSDDIQIHRKTVIFQNRNPHLDKELFIWPDFQTQFPLALLPWSVILQSLCYSGGHPAQTLPLCSNTAVPSHSQQSDRGACPPLVHVTCSTWPLLRPMGWKILVHVNKSLLSWLFHMKYQKLISTNSYL